MPNANYRRGTRAEKRTREWLERQGYFVVESRGSHGACDLIALRHDGVVVVQVKSGRALSATERVAILRSIYGVPIPSNGKRWLLTWLKWGREPQVEEL